MIRKLFATFALLLAFAVNALGQKITGVILDASTGDSLSLAGVSYKERKTSTIADLDGLFSIARINGATLTFSCMGYKDEKVNVTKATPSRLTIKLKPDTKSLQEVVIKAERKRYVRKDNPAVELMKRVIEAKKSTKLENTHDFFQYTKYQKLSMALNDYKVKEIDSTDIAAGKVKWTQQAELSPYNNKMVVPVSLDETVTKHVFRKDPRAEKDIIQGEQSSGLNQLVATGDIVNTTLKEVFQDVDIYDNYVKLLKFPFLSPIGSGATAFYRYYIVDTVLVERDSCYHLQFTPNNPQDIGFNGDIYILKDSTLHVKKCHLSIPPKSDVNFVSSLHIDQIYSKLPNDEWVLTTDDMWAEMTLLSKKFLVVRNTRLSDYDFAPLQKSLFRNKAKVIHMADSRNQDEEFWNQYRAVQLSEKEGGLNSFMEKMAKSKAMRIPLFIVKALFENYIETSKAGKPSKFDIGPVTSMFSHNYSDGFRARIGGKTTGAFNKHFFLEGYYTHGFKSHNSYYGVVVDYCFNKKKYSPYEFPMRKIRFESSYEVTSAADRFLQNSKDNLFVSLKTEKVNMQYKTNMQRLSFTWETDYGLNFNTAFKLESNEVAGDLHFIHVTDGREDKTLRTTQWSAEVHFCPGQTYIMTKQDRWPLNKDRPDFVIRHTVGIKGLFGGQFNTNQTDISVSYVEQEGTLNMLHNMELFMDRRVSWSVEWNLNGKIFNRIPLLKKLKLREYIGFKGCWGMLTDKNNPAKNTTDDLLYAFPDNRSYAIDSHVPYMEFSCGIRNILKLFGVDYVRRLNYLDIPGAKKNGVRFNLTLSF